MKLTWGRARKDHSLVADHRVYRSTDGRYRVVLVHFVYGGPPPAGYPDVWYAMANTPRDRIISQHRGRRAAKEACRMDSRRIELETAHKARKKKGGRRR